MPKNEELKVFLDLGEEVTKFVCEGLKEDGVWLGKHIALGIKKKEKLIGGVIFNDIRVFQDVWLTIYTNDKHWCNRRVLKAIFYIAFNFLGCRRASVRVDAKNKKSLNLVERLGFKKEGILRGFENNGHDGVVYSMFKNECRWRTTENE